MECIKIEAGRGGVSNHGSGGGDLSGGHRMKMKAGK